jgi:hypothetical protein
MGAAETFAGGVDAVRDTGGPQPFGWDDVADCQLVVRQSGKPVPPYAGYIYDSNPSIRQMLCYISQHFRMNKHNATMQYDLLQTQDSYTSLVNARPNNSNTRYLFFLDIFLEIP